MLGSFVSGEDKAWYICGVICTRASQMALHVRVLPPCTLICTTAKNTWYGTNVKLEQRQMPDSPVVTGGWGSIFYVCDDLCVYEM